MQFQQCLPAVALTCTLENPKSCNSLTKLASPSNTCWQRFWHKWAASLHNTSIMHAWNIIVNFKQPEHKSFVLKGYNLMIDPFSRFTSASSCTHSMDAYRGVPSRSGRKSTPHSIQLYLAERTWSNLPQNYMPHHLAISNDVIVLQVQGWLPRINRVVSTTKPHCTQSQRLFSTAIKAGHDHWSLFSWWCLKQEEAEALASAWLLQTRKKTKRVGLQAKISY